MTARFILSFDCEGKWGVADCLGPFERRKLTDARLRQAYRGIVALLDEYQIPATFAFVGAFSQSAACFRWLRPHLEELRVMAPDYIGPALRDIDETGEGWHGDWAVDMVGSATRHEIALHGVSHVPWTSVGATFIDGELALFRVLVGPVRESRTFVYPRNMVAHVHRLPEFGIIGYRQAPPARSRLFSLASEFNVFARPEEDPPRSDPQSIPAGYFVNWKHGPRRLVPTGVSAYRANHILATAFRRQAVVHYWLHPENVASEPNTLDVLRCVLREVALQREAGRCHVLTQLDYCHARGTA